MKARTFARVDETTAGKRITVVTVYKGARHIADIMAYHSPGFNILVNVRQSENAAIKTGRAMVAAGLSKLSDAHDWRHKTERDQLWDIGHMVAGRGYGELTDALSGLYVDGLRLYGHAARDQKTERLLKRYQAAMAQLKAAGATYEQSRAAQLQWDDKAEKIGARFANWQNEKGFYGSLFYRDGLRRLESLGYSVNFIL